MSRKLTQKEIQSRINAVHGENSIVVIGDYINAKTRCYVDDLRCDHSRWLSYPHGVIQGRGCPECGNIRRSKSNSLSQKQTQLKITETHGENSIIIFKDYINAGTKCWLNDERCDHPSWYAIPNNIINGKTTGCPECGKISRSKSNTHSREQTQQKVDAIHGEGNITIIEGYKNTMTKCQFNDVRCEHSIWTATPNGIIRGNGCPECGYIKAAKSRTASQKQTQRKIDAVHGEGNIVILSGYKLTHAKCWFNDVRCNHPTWLATPSHIIYSGSGCPACKSNNITANKIIDRIKNLRLHTYFKKECSPDFLGLKKYDLAMVLKNGVSIAFEYDGEYHDRPHWSLRNSSIEEKRASVKKVQRRDAEKNKESLENGIHLIRLNYKTLQDNPEESVQHVLDEIVALSEGVEAWEEWLEDVT